MTKIEAQELVQKISVIFANTGFSGESGKLKRVLYIEKFENLDYEVMNRVIDKMILTNKYLPSISEFYEIHQNAKKKQSMRLPIAPTKNNCNICGGRGFIVKPRMVNMLSYDYLYHCDCEAGLQWTYDGTLLEEDQS